MEGRIGFDGNYRPDLKGLRQQRGAFMGHGVVNDGNYRPDLKGLRRCAGFDVCDNRFDGNYRPDLKGLRRLAALRFAGL